MNKVNCYDCRFFKETIEGFDMCNKNKIDKPIINIEEIECMDFEPFESCENCINRVILFFCAEQYDYEVDYGCRLQSDKYIYGVCSTLMDNCNKPVCKIRKYKEY